MRALIIEDQEAKEADIKHHLETLIPGELLEPIHSGKTMSEAVALLSKTSYDVIVLDLMLPFIAGSPAQSGAGIELLKLIRSKESRNRGALVVGLSSYPDEVSDKKTEFERHGVLIVAYSDGGHWRESLAHIVRDTLARSESAPKLDFIIIVALEEEQNGFAHCDIALGAWSVIGGLNVQFAKIYGREEFKGAVVRLREMGLVAATFDTSVAVKLFKPRVVCMSGICAGVAGHSELGQVVVASPAWEYQAGKWSSEGFQIAPHQIPLKPKTRVLMEQSICKSEVVEILEARLPKEAARPPLRTTPAIGPAATGSAVIADVNKLSHIEDQHRKLAAIDMETFGVYYAVHESQESVEHFVSIKCVVDLANANKGNELHLYGCISAARASTLAMRALLEA